MTNRNDVVRAIVEDFYGGDLNRAAKETGYSKQQFTNWLADKNRPQKSIVQWLIHRAFVPEFKIIAEYRPIDGSSPGLLKALKEMIGDHSKASGIYAFYDSMGGLAYVGKSNGNLLGEIYQQLNARMAGNVLPKGEVDPDFETGA